MALVAEVLHERVVRLPRQTRAPRVDRSAEVEQLGTARRPEAGDPTVVHDREAVVARVVDLAGPALPDTFQRKGVRLLGEDVAEPRDGTITLHDEEVVEVGVDERSQHRHSGTVCRLVAAHSQLDRSRSVGMTSVFHCVKGRSSR